MPYLTSQMEHSRLLYLRNKNKQAEAQASAVQGVSSGPPVAAEPLEEVTTTAPRMSFSDIQADIRAEEATFAKNMFRDATKATAAIIAGLPVDIYNLSTMATGFDKVKSASSDWFKDVLGVEEGSAGEAFADFNPGMGAVAGLTKASGLLKAGMFVPLAFWKNKDEAAQAGELAEQMAKEFGLFDGPIDDTWRERNKLIFERTKGWFYDFNGNLRKYVPTEAGWLNPNLVNNGQIRLGKTATVGHVLHPDVWANFSPEAAKILQKIPVKDEGASLASWSPQHGIGINLRDLKNNPIRALEAVLHEFEHGIAQAIGSGRGGDVKTSELRGMLQHTKERASDDLITSLKRAGLHRDTVGTLDRTIRELAHRVSVKGESMESIMRTNEGQFLQKWIEKEPRAKFFWDTALAERQAYKKDYDDYLRVSGEVLARLAEATWKGADKGGNPLDMFDVPLNELTKEQGRVTDLQTLPQREGVFTKVKDLVTDIVQRSVDPAADVKKGKFDEELRLLIGEQHADAVRDRSRFKQESLNQQVRAAREQAGVDPRAVLVRGERINEAFPRQTGDYIVGQPAAPGQPNTQRTVETQRARDTQGARVDDSRGGPPSQYEGFGKLLEQAELLAVGREEVWRSRKFNIEAFQNKLETVARARQMAASKGSVSQRTSAKSTAPKFWAFDPDTGKVLQVTADPEGGFKVTTKTGKVTENTMEMVDIVANRKGLNEFISKVLWKRATGEPIKFLDPTE